MKHEVKVPSAGESITEVFIGTWLKQSGDLVRKGEVLVDLETQKATFELEAEYSGRLHIIHGKSGEKVAVGDVIATIDAGAELGESPAKPQAEVSSRQESRPLAGPVDSLQSPALRKMLAERRIDPKTVIGSGKKGRLLKEDLQTAGLQDRSLRAETVSPYQYSIDPTRGDRQVPATRIRRQIAENLVRAQHTAAILSTFNEIDMSQVMDYRKENKERFQKEHGLSPGIVGFFALASVRALQLFPIVNAVFTGEEIIHHDYIDISVAVSSERGLVVPVIRDAHTLRLLDFEKQLLELSDKARLGKLSIPEMSGGTFTITNGGVFGSLMSTPLINMPQSAILGLHKVEKRPMVVNDEIVIRPMMYVALSYDHRLIDGKDAVQFLVAIKQGIEDLKLIINQMI